MACEDVSEIGWRIVVLAVAALTAAVVVVRCFDDENVVHVDGTINPLKDVETINLELIFADLEVLEKKDQKLEKLIFEMYFLFFRP